MFNIVLCELSYHLFFFWIQDLYSYNKKLTKHFLCNYNAISFLNNQAIAANNFTFQTYLFWNVYFPFNFESVKGRLRFASSRRFTVTGKHLQASVCKISKIWKCTFTLRLFNYKRLKTSLAAFTKTFFGRTQLFQSSSS